MMIKHVVLYGIRNAVRIRMRLGLSTKGCKTRSSCLWANIYNAVRDAVSSIHQFYFSIIIKIIHSKGTFNDWNKNTERNGNETNIRNNDNPKRNGIVNKSKKYIYK